MTNQKEDRLDYLELAALDMGAMKAFYSGVFGWTFVDFGPQYSSFQLGHLDGGFSTEREVSPVGQGTLIVFYANDIEAVERRVLEFGGRLTKELFEFPGGRRFQFVDPSGNEIAVWAE